MDLMKDRMENPQEMSDSKAVSLLCSLGLFLAGYIFYSSSLIESFYRSELSLSSWHTGIAQSAVPLGAIAGAILAGRLTDLFGRNRVLVWNFLFIVIFGLLSGLCFDFYSLCIARTLNGFFAGTLYPLCAAYLIEMTPPSSHARKTAFLMFVNCLAAPIGCIVAILLSLVCDNYLLWRLIAMGHCIPALFALWWVKRLPESHVWMVTYKNTSNKAMGDLKVIFSNDYKNITICLIAAWFLMDVAYYGINFFVPYLLQAMQVKTIVATLSNNQHILLSDSTLWGTFIINIFFMLGALAAIFIVEKVNLLTLQKYGFLFASLSLLLLATYFHVGLHQRFIIILLFVLFNFSINLGPDVTTYLLSATSYPVEIRGSGHGFIAGFAKSGSFIGVLLLPKIQDYWGYETVILSLSLLLFAAYLFTLQFAKILLHETTKNEEHLNYETT